MNPINRSLLIKFLNSTVLEKFKVGLIDQLDQKYANPKHGNFNDWEKLIETLPEVDPSIIDLKRDAPVIGDPNDCTPEIRESIKENLKALSPWRKGPFNIFGIYIDSEWRSDWKWARIASCVTDLKDKTVLDIGCSNGYYALRMQAMGAKLVIGIDPTWLYVFQFMALQRFLKNTQRVFILPFALKDLSDTLTGFDVIFSMGALYHQQQPQTHLSQIHRMLNTDGQLILETLIIEDKDADVLIPNERYANMRNIWMIPSYALLRRWLQESGFINSQLVDVTTTSVEEQRQTEWMTGYSLADALNPNEPSLTVEGYPAPMRAIITTSKAG